MAKRPIVKCSFCGEITGGYNDTNKFGIALCHRHYNQRVSYGENYKTYYDKNEINIKDKFAEMVLYNRKLDITGIAIIDKDDVELVKEFRWRLCKNGYVTSNANKILLHRLITNCPENMVVDHINHNTLDNRKCN